MHELVWQIPLILITGIAAGFLNVIAGGGSLLTLPMLIFLGLPGAKANGTNRVAVAIQCATGVAGFRVKGFSDFRFRRITDHTSDSGRYHWRFRRGYYG